MRDWKFDKRKRKTIAVNRHGFLENKGFSLAELLIVVAIIGILAAFGFVALAQHQRSLKLTEDDNIAREIYAAVQNKLTQLSADGSWEKLVKDKETDSSYWGESVSLDAAGDTGESSAAHAFYRIVVNQGNVTAGSNRLTLNNSVLGEKLLPTGAIDDTIRSGGSYIVEYDRATNQVRAVFYTDRTHGIFLSAQSGTLVSDDANALRGKSKSERMHYSSNTLQDVCVGYYDGAVVDGEIPEDDSDDIPAASLTLTNGDNLVLSGTLTWKQAASASQYQARIAVHGVTSGKEVYLSNGFTLTPASTALPNIVLDSDTEQDRHFKQLCIDRQSTPLINGEDIYCTLEINGKVVATSNTENSLFATADSGVNGPNTVTVRNGRHLENLSEEISGIQTVTSARLAASISFSEYIGTGCIYDVSGKAQTAGEYIGIESSSLTMLDGGGYAISGLAIGQLSKEGGNKLSGKNAGFISSVPDTLTSFQISNLTLDSPSFAALSADNAGFIIGSADGKKITLSDVTVRNPAAKGLSSNSLGGLIGLAGAESVNIANCKVEGNNGLTLSNRGTVGGLIGSVSGGEDGADVSLRASSLTAQSNSVIAAAKGSVGGLIGSYDGGKEASAALAISSSSVDVSGISDLSGDTGAGGLIGEAKEGAVTLSGCSVSGLKKITSANGSAGGIVGALASTVSSFRQTGTAFKSSDSYLVTANNGSAGGLIGSSDAAAFVLRPGTAGSLSGIDTLTVTGKNAGGVVGSLQFTEPSELSYATLSAKKAVITGGVDAGGILGCGKDSSTLKFVGNCVQCADLTVNGQDAAGGMIAAIDDTRMHISSCRVSSEIPDSIAITSKGTAGGMLGRARANGNELGTTASPALVISESSVETASLKVSAGSFAGGFIGQTENVISQITNSSVIGGKEGMVQSESSDAGGFIGRQTGSTASTFTDDFSSILVKSEGLSVTAVGGFAGRLESAIIGSCYAAGRTDKGAYQDSPFDQNVLASRNSKAFAGGFAGLTGSGTAITGSYSTCSVKNDSTAADSTAGGFVGTNGGTISQSYCTGLVTGSQTSAAGIFAGNSSQKTEKGNYCLSDLDRNPALVSGDQADIAKAVLHADPAIIGAGKDDSALPYDTALDTGFPFKTVSELNQTSSIHKHVGDWPTQFKARSFDQDCGILYYEAVQHGETKTENPEYFYHGYMLNLPASSTSGEKNCVEVSTKDTLTPSKNTVLNDHGLDSAPGGGDYVIDDGYLILVAEDADLSKTGLNVYYNYYSIRELVNNNYLQEYSDVENKLGITGYKAYYFCFDSVINGDYNKQWWMINGASLSFSKYTDNSWDKSISSIIYADLYFSDCISAKPKDDKTNYSIRSANQLNRAFKTGIILSSQKAIAVTIDMDITFSTSTVDFIHFGGKRNNDYYISPTIDEISGTLKSTETPGRTITNVNGTEVKDHYRLIAVNNIFANHVQGKGIIDSIHFVNITAASITNDIRWDGSIRNCYIESSNFTGNGAIVNSVPNQGGGIISDCTVINSTIKGNGIAGDVNALTAQNCYVLNNEISGNGAFGSVSGSSASIQNVSVSGNNISGNGFLGSNSDGSSITSCTVADNSIGGNGFLSQNGNGGKVSNCNVQNCTIGGNGFAESNGQSDWAPIIDSCFVINAAIGQNGFLYKNDGRGIISNCGVYSDKNSYEQSGQFEAPTKYLDDSVNFEDKTLGYNLVQIGDKEHETAAGFVNNNQSTIQNCFTTGKVIGKKAAGFFIKNSGTITGSYANALVYGEENGSGFGLTLDGGTVEQSHSVGKIMGGDTEVGFVDTIQSGSVRNCYSAVWSMKDDASNSYLFAHNLVNTGRMSNNGYLSDIGFSFNQDVAEKVKESQIKAYSYQQLSDSAAQGESLGTKANNSVVYGQYTTEKDYPFPMPSGMISFGDWSHSNGYTIVFDPNAPEGAVITGTMQNMTGVSYAQDTALTRNQYVCTDSSQLPDANQYEAQYHFAFWTLKQDGSGKSYSDGATDRALQKDGQTVTLYAQWIKGYWGYSYKGSYDVFTAPIDGIYKLEAWGAQGGDGMTGSATAPDILARDSKNTDRPIGIGGKGAYASNYVSLKKDQQVYVYVGGAGDMAYADEKVVLGGWNGGGNAKSEISSKGDAYLWGSGGGATCMTILNDGQRINDYPTLSSYADADKKSQVIVVAGGGGGAGAPVGKGVNNGGAGVAEKGIDGSGDSHGKGGSATSGGTGDARYYKIIKSGREKVALKGVPTSDNLVANGSFGAGGGINNTEQYKGNYSITIEKVDIGVKMLTGAVNGSGGGGGWYGGGMGYFRGSSAGGGSSYINKTTTAAWYVSDALLTPQMIDGNSSMPSPISMDTGKTIIGREGDGFARISLVNVATSQEVGQ